MLRRLIVGLALVAMLSDRPTVRAQGLSLAERLSLFRSNSDAPEDDRSPGERSSRQQGRGASSARQQDAQGQASQRQASQLPRASSRQQQHEQQLQGPQGRLAPGQDSPAQARNPKSSRQQAQSAHPGPQPLRPRPEPDVEHASHEKPSGLASKLRLSKLLPWGSGRDSEPAGYDEPPSAYDDSGSMSSESQKPGRGSALPSRQPSTSQSSARRAGGASPMAHKRPSRGPANGGQAPRGPMGTGARLIAGTAPAGSGASPGVASGTAPMRVARRSPSTRSRSEELAEALRGIGTDQGGTMGVNGPDLPVAESSDLPSYLQGETPRAGQTSRSANASSTSSSNKAQAPQEGIFDLSAALRRAERQDEIAAQAGAATASEGADAPTEGTTPPPAALGNAAASPTSKPNADPVPQTSQNGGNQASGARTATSSPVSNPARTTIASAPATGASQPNVPAAAEGSEAARSPRTAAPNGNLSQSAATGPPSVAAAAREGASVVVTSSADARREPAAASQSSLASAAEARPSRRAAATGSPSVGSTTRERSEKNAAAQPSPDGERLDAVDVAADDSAHSQDAEAPATGQVDGDRQLLSSVEQPLLTSRVEGPRQIIVGREAHYFVTLSNLGQTAARDVAVHVDVPAWADVADSQASLGMVETQPDGEKNGTASGNTKQLAWRLNDLAAGSAQTLDLTLVPREGRDLQLGVRWNHAPVGSAAVVEVQEPILHMEISGPADVLYGDPQRYTLVLHNPGTGVAENVTLELVPPGGNEDSLVTHPVGAVKPGDRKTIELELTARQAGDLAVRATAVATGGLRTETVKNVFCRKPELEIDWRGPDKKYSGSTATYYFRLRNPGTAMTGPVAVEVVLPAGAEFVRASDGHAVSEKKENAQNGSVAWRISGMRPSEEEFLELQCRLTRPGANEFALSAQTTDGLLNVSKTITASVIALADLNLEVVDPSGPVPVGELAEYAITIRNRGTTTARKINVVGLFSKGIEPVSVRGAQHTIGDGRVAFHTIDELPAGRETILKIDAKAATAGTHSFRAEVVCEDLEIKLSADETTKFFVDEYRWDSPSTAYAK